MPTKTFPSPRLACFAVIAFALFLSGCSEDAAKDTEYADRMSAEHAGDQPDASPATVDTGKEEAKLVTLEVAYTEVEGQSVNGYLAKPLGATQGSPGVIVIQEWWGLNDNIRAMARKLAAQGYVALAVDLYGGQVAEDPAGARELMTQAMKNPAAGQANLRGAYDFLVEQEKAGNVGSIGWCFGGGWSLIAAEILPAKLDAAVIYYGRVSADPEELSPITAPVLGHFGAEDQGIPVDSVRAFETTMESLGKPVEVHVYEGANHAFANPSGTRYDEVAADQAWERTLAFFDEHLGS